MIEKQQKKENCSQKLDVSGPLRYAIFGFFFTGPLSHFFVFVAHWVPSEAPLVGVNRLLLARFRFAPAFLLLFCLVMSFLDGKDGRLRCQDEERALDGAADELASLDPGAAVAVLKRCCPRNLKFS
ncbi:Peroxisomal membrane protein 2 [Camelus dromedarius]|uniref:Peroxisomal membrane protein 2 n=1 Tax=Camelus dromedarius TaxID=9838 RepID=A0A5N4C5D1_CAMDR|nr:Peroxisomal membrane protein 2 [Camelus dromedarius]